METSPLKNKRKFIYLLVLLLTAGLYNFQLPFRTASTKIVLLFTSNSSELIIGYINAYATPVKPIVAIGLMGLQAIVAPFKYEIVMFANVKVFGLIMGSLLSIIGRIIGAYICFDIGRVLIGDKVASMTDKMRHQRLFNQLRKGYLVPILIRLIPVNFDFLSYLSGGLRLDGRKYMLIATGWIILTTGL